MRASRIVRVIRPAPAAGAIALAVDVLYLALLAAQNDPTGSREAFVSATLAGCAALAFSAFLLPPALGAGVLALAGVTLAAWSVLAIFSIGLLLAPAAALALVALGHELPTARGAGVAAAAGAGVASLLLVVVGLVWTS